MNRGIKLLGSIFGVLSDYYSNAIIEMGEIKLVSFYIKGLKFIRLGLIGMLGLIICLIFLAQGLIFLPFALVLLTPWDAETKLLTAIAFSSVYILVPIIIFLRIFSEKKWMIMSNANSLIREITNNKKNKL